MAEQDFSKVVQQLQIANQNLENLTRIQSEGGTAKGIIASALPEIINEKQIFGQEKQFQKDEGITAVDELQSETTDAIKDLEQTNKISGKQNQAQLKMSAKIQQEFSNNNVNGFNNLNTTQRNRAIQEELTRRETIKELTEQRRDIAKGFDELDKTVGKNTANDNKRSEEDKKIQLKILEQQKKDPNLDPSQRKAIEKKQKELQGSAISKALGGIMKPINAVVDPIKKFLGIKGGIPGVSVANLAKLFIAIPLLITFLKSDFFQGLINLLETVGAPILNVVTKAITFLRDRFLQFGTGVKKFSEGDILNGLVDMFLGGGAIVLAFIGIKKLLIPLLTLNFLRGGISGVVNSVFAFSKRLTGKNILGKLKNMKPTNLLSAGMTQINSQITRLGNFLKRQGARIKRSITRFGASTTSFTNSMSQAGNNLNQQTTNINKQNKKNQKNQKQTKPSRRPRGRFGFLTGALTMGASLLPFGFGGGDAEASPAANMDVAPVDQQNINEQKKVEKDNQKNAKSKIKSQSKGFLSKALGFGAKAARFAGPIGLAVTAVGGITSGVMAGVEEFNKSGSVGKAINQGLGGVTEFLSFGLINKDTVAGALDSITGASAKVSETAAETVGMVDKVAQEEIKNLEKRIAEAKERIAQSESGKKLRTHGYRKSQVAGREADAERIIDLEEQLKKLLTQKHAGGFIARGQLAMVGERGAELVMANSPAQVFNEARTDQIGMNAVSKLMNGGGGMGGATVMVNTGGNTSTNVTRNVKFSPSTHLDTNFDRYQKFA